MHADVRRSDEGGADQAVTWVHVQETPSKRHGPEAHQRAPGGGRHALPHPGTSRNVQSARAGGEGGLHNPEYSATGGTRQWQVPHPGTVPTRVTDVPEVGVPAMDYWDDEQAEGSPLRALEDERLVLKRHNMQMGDVQQYGERAPQYGTEKRGPVGVRPGPPRGYRGPGERYTMEAVADMPLAAAARREGAQGMPTPNRAARTGSAQIAAICHDDDDAGSNDENQPPPSHNFAVPRAPTPHRAEQPFGSSPGRNAGPAQGRQIQDGQYAAPEQMHSHAALSYHQARTPSGPARAGRQHSRTPSHRHAADALSHVDARNHAGSPRDIEDFRERGERFDASGGREGGPQPRWQGESVDAGEGRPPDFESLQKDLRRLEARVVAAEAQATRQNRSARSGSSRTTPSRAQGSCPPALSPEPASSPAPAALAALKAQAHARSRVEEAQGRADAAAGTQGLNSAFQREAWPTSSGAQAPDDERRQPSRTTRDPTPGQGTLHSGWAPDPEPSHGHPSDWDPRPGRAVGQHREPVPRRGLRGDPGEWGQHGGMAEGPKGALREQRRSGTQVPREQYPGGAEATSRRDHGEAGRPLWEPQEVQEQWVDEVGRPMSPRTLEALLQKALRHQGLKRGAPGRPADRLENGLPREDGHERGGSTWHMDEVDLGLQALRASILERERSHRQVRSRFAFCVRPTHVSGAARWHHC